MLASDPGTLGGSDLASWAPLTALLIVFAVVVAVLFALGRTDPGWGGIRALSRVPSGLTRLTGIPGWAVTAIGTALFGLLVAGEGFYSDVSWHIARGRDDQLFTAPHASILIGLVLILGGAVLGTFVATMDRVEGIEVLGLRVPVALLPLWALGGGAVLGFPLDEVWHGAYGIDVTMWSPTHMLMILGASFTGMACWLVLGATGVQPTSSRWGRGLHVVCGWLTLQGLVAPQGEFTFGVPQFSQLVHPILICIAAGVALVAIRIVHGRWWTLGIVTGSWLLMGSGILGGEDEGGPVETRHGATFLASAAVVELVALLLGTERRLRFALVSGFGIGTVGLAGEWAWNRGAYQPWTSALLPEAAVFGLVAAVGAAVIGAAFARGIVGGALGVPPAVVAVAALACVAAIVLPLPRGTASDVRAAVTVEPVGDGLADVTATLDPPSAADEAYWFQLSAWQGGGLALADMEETDVPGVWRSAEPIPITGHWKTLLRLHRYGDMSAIPIWLPADPTIDEPEIPAVDRAGPFESEREYLLRETVDGNRWLSPVVHAGLVLVCAAWACAFVVAVRGRLFRWTPPSSMSTRHAPASST